MRTLRLQVSIFNNHKHSNSKFIIVIFLVLDDETITQVLSNILQVKERGATVIVLTNVPKIETLIEADKKIDYLIRLFEKKSYFAAL